MQTVPSQKSTFDDNTWWDQDGFLDGLHTLLDPLREPYVISTLRRAGTFQGSRVLDIGSGGGFLAATLSDSGYQVIGIDPAMATVRDAATHVTATFAVARGEKLPFADGSFESVVCSEVLEHVENPGAVMAEISRVLCPGGVLVFSLPNRTLLSRLVLIYVAQGNRLTRVLPRDLHDWSRFIGTKDLRDLARRHDLAVRDLQGVSIRARDMPAAACALVGLRRNRSTYADAGSKIRLHLSRLRAISYIGYAFKVQ